jgi:diguanylate cyclase (GGDEF)-like protein
LAALPATVTNDAAAVREFRLAVLLASGDVEAAETLLFDRDHNFSSELGWWPTLGPFFPGGLMLRDFDEHRLHRRLLQSAFRRAALDRYVAATLPEVEAAVARWPVGAPVRFYPMVKRLLLEHAARVFLGLSLGDDARRVMRAFTDLVAGPVAAVPFALPGTARWRALRAREAMAEMLRALIPARRAADGDDMFTRLCRDAEDVEGRLTDDDDESVLPTALPVARARQGERIDGALFRVHRDDGMVRDLSMNARPMYADDFDDRPGGVTTFTDVTVQRAAERQLRFLTERDELTGLLNRRGFMEAARQRLQACRENEQPCAMLYGDLDRFKSINDTFGHAAGDEALREMAMVLSQVFRNDDLVARLGGDEFTVFVTGVGVSAVERMLSRLEERLATLNADRAAAGGAPWIVAASFGAAIYGGGDVSVDDLLKQADTAQYRIKSERKAARAA